VEDSILATRTAFVSMTEPYDLGSTDGRMMAGIKALFDGWQREGVSQRKSRRKRDCRCRRLKVAATACWIPSG
jgi:hypothetical protein